MRSPLLRIKGRGNKESGAARKLVGFCRTEAGNEAIPFAASLILLLGLATLVIDLGHACVVTRERLRQHGPRLVH